MSLPAIAALARFNLPRRGTPVTVGATSTAAQALPTTGPSPKVLIKATQKTHIAFGDSDVTAATTDDFYLTADQDYCFQVPAGVTHWRAIRGGASDASLWIIPME